jgi:curved DNA-binding protein CbpA
MYDVLSVGTSAGPDEIKAAYRRAALRWHPDACPGGADQFMMAREAYEVLSDPERRRGYDIQLRFGDGFGGFGSSGAARQAGYADWEAQLAGLQWRAATEARGETWGDRMRRAAAQTSSSSH